MALNYANISGISRNLLWLAIILYKKNIQSISDPPFDKNQWSALVFFLFALVDESSINWSVTLFARAQKKIK